MISASHAKATSQSLPESGNVLSIIPETIRNSFETDKYNYTWYMYYSTDQAPKNYRVGRKLSRYDDKRILSYDELLRASAQDLSSGSFTDVPADSQYRDHLDRWIKVDENTAVPNASAVFIAMRTPREYKLTLRSESGELIAEQLVKYGTNFDSIKAYSDRGTKAGYKFRGWFDSNGRWTIIMPAHDLTLYQQFTPNTYKATWHYDDQTKTTSIEMDAKILRNCPFEVPDGTAWYTDLNDMSTLVSENSTMKDGNIDLYAKEPVHEHTWDAGSITKQAACTEDGEKLFTCTECAETKTETVTKLGHDLVHHEGKEATCTEKGWKEYDTCSRCDYTSYEEIAALGHDLVHHEGKEATCTKKGWNAYDTCSRCDYTTYKEIASLGHDKVEETVDPAPVFDDEGVCTGWKAGSKTVKCSRGDYKDVTEIKADPNMFSKDGAELEIPVNRLLDASQTDADNYVPLSDISIDVLKEFIVAAGDGVDAENRYDLINPELTWNDPDQVIETLSVSETISVHIKPTGDDADVFNEVDVELRIADYEMDPETEDSSIIVNPDPSGDDDYQEPSEDPGSQEDPSIIVNPDPSGDDDYQEPSEDPGNQGDPSIIVNPDQPGDDGNQEPAEDPGNPGDSSIVVGFSAARRMKKQVTTADYTVRHWKQTFAYKSEFPTKKDLMDYMKKKYDLDLKEKEIDSYETTGNHANALWTWFELVKTEECTGTIGEQIPITILSGKEIKGYEEPERLPQIEITADGSAAADIYYELKETKVTYNLNLSSGMEYDWANAAGEAINGSKLTIKGLYGQAYDLPTVSKRRLETDESVTDYALNIWNKDKKAQKGAADCGGKFGEKDLTFYAVNAVAEVTEKAQTQVQTEAPTETHTEAATEIHTEAPTEKQTEAPTEKQTEEQTEKQTEKPTEPATEACRHQSTEVRGEKAADCTSAGYTGDTYCAACGVLLQAGNEVPAKGHTAGRQENQNNIPASCTANGSYEVVTFCAECGAEINRQTVATESTGHAPGAAVTENDCEASYDQVVRCSICGTELSRQTVMKPTE